MVGEPSVVFMCNAVVDKSFIRKLETLCKSIVGFDAGRLYPYSR